MGVRERSGHCPERGLEEALSGRDKVTFEHPKEMRKETLDNLGRECCR